MSIKDVSSTADMKFDFSKSEIESTQEHRLKDSIIIHLSRSLSRFTNIFKDFEKFAFEFKKLQHGLYMDIRVKNADWKNAM